MGLFFERHFEVLEPELQQAFVALLDAPDADLFEWLTQKNYPEGGPLLFYIPKSLAPWVQGPVRLSQSRLRRLYLITVHTAAMAVALLFCLTTYPQVSAWDAVIAFILAVVSSGCVLCSALYYWRVEAHKRLIALFYDGVYWHLTFPSSGERPRLYRAELVRGSSVTYRSLFSHLSHLDR